MTPRFTKKMLQTALENYGRATNQKVAKSFYDEGYALDHYQPGGNKYVWALRYHTADGRDVTQYPTNSRRYTAEGMYDMLWFGTNTAWQMEANANAARAAQEAAA